MQLEKWALAALQLGKCRLGCGNTKSANRGWLLHAIGSRISVSPALSPLSCLKDVADSGTRTFDLEKDEQVLEKASRGCVAMVATNRRLLVISALGGSWTPVRYQLNEAPAYKLLVGDLVGVAISDKRFIAYDPLATRIQAVDIYAQETLTHWVAGESIAAVATDRRVMGFSVALHRIAERPLRLKENVEALESATDVVTVITDDRVLTLRSGSGFWAERKRPLR